jgi:hypothetical protein
MPSRYMIVEDLAPQGCSNDSFAPDPDHPKLTAIVGYPIGESEGRVTVLSLDRDCVWSVRQAQVTAAIICRTDASSWNRSLFAIRTGNDTVGNSTCDELTRTAKALD